MRRFRLSHLLLLLSLWLLPAACSDSPTPPAPAAGVARDAGAPRQAPEFTLTTLDGTPMRLRDLRGKVVFVNLWATWCPPCREELPTMVRFYERFKERGVEILAISEDTDPEAVRRMVATQGITFPVLLDENKRVFNLYRATGVPETHLLDKDGRVRGSQLGPFDWDSPAVISKVEELLQATTP
ncbi:MAG: TlpA disulfide reductase family protein [Deferrisomatales bacterium]|nr:TlpA disulfide reductase family protein [Deferrisomatales bacterium]